MTTEYPSYYDSFFCMAGSCPDTCCAGWEIEVDDETYYRYLTIPGPFGDRLRQALSERQEDGEYLHYLERRGNGSCTFLDGEHLCDIYKEMGPDGLCRTCREHPRFLTQVGGYEQVDLSLSCPGVADLFFSDPAPISTVMVRDDRPEQPLSVDDQAKLTEILAFRDSAMSGCQEHSHSPHFGALNPQASDDRWLSQFRAMEPLEDDWDDTVTRVTERLEEYQKLWPLCYSPELEQWFRKLGAYFTFRYYLDAWFDGSLIPEKLLVKKSLWFLRLLCVDRWKEHSGALTTEDVKQVVRTYSKQVEFSEPNINRLKELL